VAKTKQIVASIPDYMMEEIEKQMSQSGLNKAELTRQAFEYYLTQNGQLNTHLLGKLTQWEEEIRESKSLAGSKSRKSVNYTDYGKQLKKLLNRNKEEPVTLRFIADNLEVNRKTARSIINHFDGEFLIVCGEGLMQKGEAWKIARINTPAGDIVEELIKDRTPKSEKKKGRRKK
jgi:hypothetical protein